MFRSRMTCAVTIVILFASAAAMFAGAADKSERQPVRYGSVIGVRAEKLDEYKKLHAAVWPAVVAAMRDANIRHFTIYLRKMPDGKHYLFSHFEYVGSDYEGDMKRMAANPECKRWWTLTDPCQEPLTDRKPGEWWSAMEEVCYLE
jgi:L-rhamnose mutarotase